MWGAKMELTFEQVAKSHNTPLRVSSDGGSTWQYVQVSGNIVELGAGRGVVVIPETMGMRTGSVRHGVRAITERSMQDGSLIVEEDQEPTPRAWSYGVLSG
jgi:hypothetical protein